MYKIVRENVTDEYEQNKTPGVGSITYGKNYAVKGHGSEILMGEWLYNIFGGDIVLRAESKKDGEKSADYLWNGKLWDLKTPENERSANTAIKRGLAQIKPNAGGVILNYEGRNISMDELHSVIDKRMQWLSEGITVDIMVVRSGKAVEILRYSKK